MEVSFDSYYDVQPLPYGKRCEGEMRMTPLKSSSYVARRLNVNQRTVTSWAAQGRIPGATKLCGVWRFDPIKLERWIKHGEPKPWAPNVSAAKYGGDLSKVEAVPGRSLLRQLVGL